MVQGVQGLQVFVLIQKVEHPVEPQVGQWVGSGWVCILGDADWPGLGGRGGGWAGVTNSSPDSSDSLSDSEIDGSFMDARFFFASFAGNRVSLNFTSQEISMRWLAAFQNWYPLEPGS